MQIKSFYRVSRLLILAILSALIISSCGMAANFSADVIHKRGPEQMKGKIYVNGKKLRQDVAMKNRTQIVIVRADKGVTWMLDPSKKQYMEMPGGSTSWKDPKVEAQLKKMATKKDLGKQTINGFACNKYQYVFKTKGRGPMTQWVAVKLDWPIKMEMKEGPKTMVMEYKNIKEGKPSDSVFELPKGYKKISPKMPSMPINPGKSARPR